MASLRLSEAAALCGKAPTTLLPLAASSRPPRSPSLVEIRTLGVFAVVAIKNLAVIIKRPLPVMRISPVMRGLFPPAAHVYERW